MKQSLVSQGTKKLVTNPFYKMVGTLTMLQQCSKMTDNPSKSVVVGLLNNAWKECEGDITKRKMFFSVLFSLGDISNREHNIFKKRKMKKVDSGGSSLRKVFLYALEWLHNNVAEQFYSFLPIVGEYYNLGANTMYHLLWTDRWKGTITEVYKVNVDADRLTDYITSVLRSVHTSETELKLWAKWLWHIPTSNSRTRRITVTEKGLKSMRKYEANCKVGDVIVRQAPKQRETNEKDKTTLECIQMLSDKMGWAVRKYAHNIKFEGYKNFRKSLLADTEAAMFSSQNIRLLDKIQLLEWFDKLPSGARYNVQRRLFNLDKSGSLVSKDRWITEKGLNIANVYSEWLKLKETAQKELRELSIEDKVEMAKKTPDVLKSMEKAAKVNTAGDTILDVIASLLGGGSKQSLDLAAQSIMDKVVCKVPILVTVDNSGSMKGKSLTHKGVSFSASEIASIAATTFLLKNPDVELQDIIIRFDSTASVIAKGNPTEHKGQRFMSTTTKNVEWVTDQKKSFLENYQNVSSLIPNTGGATYFNKVATELKRWVDEIPEYSSQRIDMIQRYQVFLVISDGDMNSSNNPNQSMLEFQSSMRQWFGWEGVVVVWDVKKQSEERSKFDDMENVMYYGGCNPSILNQIFTNIDECSIIDVYTPLESLYNSNRYSPVRELVL